MRPELKFLLPKPIHCKIRNISVLIFVYFVKLLPHTSTTGSRKTVHPLPQPPPSFQESARARFYIFRRTQNHIARKSRSFELCSDKVEFLA